MILCDVCKEHVATIHYTEVLPNSEPKKMALCEACAKLKNLPITTQLSVADILKGLTQASQSEGEESGARCPQCDLTFARFRKGGRLGCAACYEAFQPKMMSILEEIHRETQHVGKIPKHSAGGTSEAIEVARLHKKLEQAIEKEEFEEAAILRDRIQSLKDETESE